MKFALCCLEKSCSLSSFALDIIYEDRAKIMCYGYDEMTKREELRRMHLK